MAQKKMHCALRRTHSDSRKASDRGKGFSSRKSLEQETFTSSLEDCQVRSLDWRNSDQRSSVLTFFALESDGHWRIVALPIPCLDHTNQLGSGAPLNMDGLHLVSQPSINSFKVDRQKVQKGSAPGAAYSVKPFTARNFPGYYVWHQSRHGTLANKVIRSNEFSTKSSCQSSISCSDSPALIPKGSNAINSTDMSIDNSQVDKAVKRNSRKKARKKRKQNRKLSCDIGPTEPEVISEEYAHGISTTETCGNNDMDDGDGIISSVTSPDVSLSDVKARGIVFEGNSNDVNNCSDSLKICIDEVDLSGASIPSIVQNFPGEHSIINNAEIGIQMKKQEFSMFDGGFDQSHYLQISCHDDMHSKGFSDMHDSLVLDSVSVSSNSKQVRSVSQISNVYKAGTVGNSHGRTGKENNHSVWQKKASPVCSQFGITLKEAPSGRKNVNVAEVNMISKNEDKKHLKEKVSRKMKGKIISGSKQEYNCYSGRASHLNTASLNACAKISMQQKEVLDMSVPMNDQHGSSGVSRSCSQNACLSVGFQTNRVECMKLKSVDSLQVCPGELEPLESVHNSISGINNQNVENQEGSLPKSCSSLDQSNLREVRPPVYLPHLLANKVAPMGKEGSLAEYSKLNQSSGSILQKWIPIGMKNPGLTTFAGSESSSLKHSEGSAAVDWTLRNTVKEKAVSNFQNLVSTLNAGIMCMGSGNVNSSSFADESQIHMLRYPSACTIKDNKKKHVAANCLTSETKDKSANDLNEIEQAMNDACRARLAAEAVQMVTGGPIAEFERLLQFSSPVISPSHNLISCQHCSQDQVVGASLCRHETPNISLGCLWQWYEKHGSYGLEVRAKDYENSKRLGDDRFAFRAYFVPFLSAVQLFRNHNSHSIKNSNGVSAPKVLDSHKIGETSDNSSNVGRLPIFSILVPQPHASGTEVSPIVNEACKSELPSVPANEDISVQSVDTSNDIELIFEYFEHEPPQQRRPLYNKIQELVRGDGTSWYQPYGDPTNLNSINLHDLHPRSWYSVAWYPIYRIPDGNFRAAFLTYHSLGHFVRRNAKLDSPSMDALIVSPVVGLQSYNAQSECWFQLRQSLLRQTAETRRLNPSGILKERLRTLEETAARLARAVVNKGNQTSVNRHPDFEFFLSRRRRY